MKQHNYLSPQSYLHTSACAAAQVQYLGKSVRDDSELGPFFSPWSTVLLN